MTQGNRFLHRLNYLMLMLIVAFAASSVLANDHSDDHSNESSDVESQAELANLLSSSTYYQADFEQTVRDAKGVLVDQSAGKMWLARPNKLRWDIVLPLEQTLIVNGQQFFQYDSDIDQLIIEPLSDQLSAMPVLLLSGDAEAIASQFSVTQIKAMPTSQNQKSPLRQLFSLKPLVKDGLFEVLTLEFKDGLLQAISILDDLQQNSRFEFTAIDTEKTIKDSRFDIDPPTHVDVIYR